MTNEEMLLAGIRALLNRCEDEALSGNDPPDLRYQLHALRAGEWCPKCHGGGTYVYPSSSMGGGPGGQTITKGPCPGTRRSAAMSDCPFVERS